MIIKYKAFVDKKKEMENLFTMFILHLLGKGDRNVVSIFYALGI